MIKTIRKARWFLANNPKGSVSDLESRIDKKVIEELVDATYLLIKGNNYNIIFIEPTTKRPDYNSRSFRRAIEKAKKEGERIVKLSRDNDLMPGVYFNQTA